MPTTTLHPLSDEVVYVRNAVAGTPTGTHVSAPVIMRGEVKEAGYVLDSVVTSTMTLLVRVNDASISSAASTLTEIISSTLGTVSSAISYAGAMVSFIPPARAFVNPGDSIDFVTSGGQSSTVGATFYAVIRRQ